MLNLKNKKLETRGGKRPGAGRKPHPSGHGRLYRFYLPPALGEKVKEFVNNLRKKLDSV